MVKFRFCPVNIVEVGGLIGNVFNVANICVGFFKDSKKKGGKDVNKSPPPAANLCVRAPTSWKSEGALTVSTTAPAFRPRTLEESLFPVAAGALGGGILARGGTTNTMIGAAVLVVGICMALRHETPQTSTTTNSTNLTTTGAAAAIGGAD